ncbi:MAG: sigma 54-interacting transcriptional regulator, partial [Myxococcales bacterium]|nr:sigma 54-interacting transcriptional regulator [Myxococcales bacterium]
MELLLRSADAGSALIGLYRGGTLEAAASAGMEGDRREHLLTQVSTGVLAQAMATGQWVQTSSALLDARFASRGSVRRNQIEAVLCAPVALEPDGTAVIYLQRRAGQGPFSEDVIAQVRRIADRLGAVGRAALSATTDATVEVRGRLVGCDLVGTSRALGALLEEVETVAGLDLDVLITGPSGTGKSHLARLLHANSPRSQGPFVHVNCASVTESLFDAEMFGVRSGAFTGASSDRDGFVDTARRGTLFLDEIAELPVPLQAKLLQLLQ